MKKTNRYKYTDAVYQEHTSCRQWQRRVQLPMIFVLTLPYGPMMSRKCVAFHLKVKECNHISNSRTGKKAGVHSKSQAGCKLKLISLHPVFTGGTIAQAAGQQNTQPCSATLFHLCLIHFASLAFREKIHIWQSMSICMCNETGHSLQACEAFHRSGKRIGEI